MPRFTGRRPLLTIMPAEASELQEGDRIRLSGRTYVVFNIRHADGNIRARTADDDTGVVDTAVIPPHAIVDMIHENVRRYRNKPVAIEAFQYVGDNYDALRTWTDDRVQLNTGTAETYVDTLEGPMIFNPGDYIIRGIRGEYYPCKPHIFAETYERVTDDGGEEQ